VLAANGSSRRGAADQPAEVRTGRGTPGGLAWGGGVPEGGPGENGDGDVEGVVAKRPPVALVGVEGGRVARPVGQHVA